MGGRIPLQCFFDFMVGTRYEKDLDLTLYELPNLPNSTGGIIALGLGAKNWSVEECTRHFEDLCHKAFTRRTGCNIPGVSWLIEK